MGQGSPGKVRISLIIELGNDVMSVIFCQDVLFFFFSNVFTMYTLSSNELLVDLNCYPGVYIILLGSLTSKTLISET